MKAQGEDQDQVHSDQMILMMRLGRMKKVKGKPRGLQGSSPLRLDGSWVIRKDGCVA
jgi:hypothetical protein